MTRTDFVKKYYNYAKEAEANTKVPAIFILAQCALETGWGKKAPGNMMFGIKDTDGINGNEQLITTTEYLKNPNAKFPVIISKVFLPAKKLYKYIVKTWFRKYNSPKESFEDHGKFFIENKRDHDNFGTCKLDWKCWCIEVAADGYATGTDYANTLIQVGNGIEKTIKYLKL
jgi:flagellar protein FlgJ